MKTPALILATLLLFAASMLPAATVTGRSAKATPAGTEKIPIDDAGTDKYITIGNLFVGSPALTTPTLTTPVISTGLTASGSASNNFSGSTGAFQTSSGLNTFNGSSHVFASTLLPSANDSAALGSTTYSFSDLFLASGGVINFASSNVVLTHSSNVLTLGTGELRITTAGTNSASVPTLGSTSTLTNKTLTEPVINGATSSGSTAIDFSGNSGAFKTSTGVNTFGGSTHTFAGDAKPAVDGTGNLGTAALSWDNLYLDTAAVINFDNGNAVLTHSSGILTVSTGELRVTTAGTNSASVPTLGSTSTLTNKTLTAPVLNGASSASGNFDLSGSSGTFKTCTGVNTFGGSSHVFAATLVPSANDGAALGSTSASFSDLFLASGAVINFANSNVVLTHSSGILTMGTGELRITTPGTNSASVPTLGSTSTLTNKTLTAPVIGGGLTASGSAANDFSASTGTFLTSSGANTLSGAVTIADATTPSLTTASGKTNTGYVQVNGKTSGAIKILPVDAAGQTVTLSLAAQTSGAATLTINDLAGVNGSVLTSTLTTNTPGAANAIWGVSNGLTLEGATADGSEITLSPADATADVTYLLPNAAAASYALMSSTLATNAPDIANSVTGASAALVFEGTADAHETSLTATDPTADRTVTIPNATGTVSLAQASTTTALTADDQAVTPGSNTVLQLTSDNATATNRTFTLSATGAITGQIYILIGPATNQCELADTGIQKLSATWSPTTSDSLTLLFDGTNFIELARTDN